MKLRQVILLTTSMFILSSCKWLDFFHKSQEEKPTNDSSENEDNKLKNGRFTGEFVENERYSGYEYVAKNVTKQTSGIANINIVGFNDFHGAIKEKDNESGLIQLASFVKIEAAKENTIVCDQGDTWQGSFESNENYGKLIQKTFADANLTIRTIGNHDFDWGIDKLKETITSGNDDYVVPCLGSNIYSNLESEQYVNDKNLGSEYATFVLENGVKVGIIGVIGCEQTSSICSTFIENINFENHINVAKNISDFLRTEKNCDIVVLSMHGAYRELEGFDISETSLISKERYFDLLLNGHSHSQQTYLVNGVLSTQWDSDSKSCGKVNLKYNCDTKKVINSLESDRSIYYPKYLRTYYPLDNDIKNSVENYLSKIKEKGNEILSEKFEGVFTEFEELPNLMAEAVFDVAKKQDPTTEIALVNSARIDFMDKTMTYSKLYECFPFVNQIVFMDVKGTNSLQSLIRNYSCHLEGLRIDHNKTYRVAIIDYLAYHQNSSKNYDYFSESTVVGKLMKGDSPYYYLDVLYDYLKSNPDKTFNSDCYKNGFANRFAFDGDFY